jgi:LysR family transcriptional regulator, flagellar master operon regulator
MDIALARTFLEVMAQGSFVGAAQRLHLTQTAVSARVKNLEDQLGVPLFQRLKAGTVLTPAGERFVPYASSLLQVWERARRQVALPEGRSSVAVLGCESSLWSPLLPEWLRWMREQAPEIAVRVEVGSPDALLEQIASGMLDLAVVYAPHYRAGIHVELLIEEKLVLVTTATAGSPPDPADYVFVDWGREFAEQHNLVFPQWSRPAVSSDLGPLALEYLLSIGGAGYFRLSIVQPYLTSGRLHRVAAAPEFPYPAYAVYAEHTDGNSLSAILPGLRHAAGSLLTRG